MATERTISLFQDSYQRCLSHPRFFEMFYDEFLSAHEDVQAKFEGVDMARQMRMLRASLQMVMLASQDGIDPAFYLSDVGARHARTDLDIPPPLYDKWLEALLTTAAIADPKYDAELRTAWMEIMSPGIRYMRECY
ncbi:MAG: globin [Planctomycetota bacterium]|jgi:hemoglobin-like flavoprotein